MTTSIYYSNYFKKWHARIYHRGKYFHVGRFATRKEAQSAAKAKLESLPLSVIVAMRKQDKAEQSVIDTLRALEGHR